MSTITKINILFMGLAILFTGIMCSGQPGAANAVVGICLAGIIVNAIVLLDRMGNKE